MARAFVTIILLLNISSCGFRAMYSKDNFSVDYNEELASVVIQKSPGTKSQELRTYIFDSLNPDHLDKEPKYLLILKTSESKVPTFITSLGSSGRFQMNISVNYQLKTYDGRYLIASGSANDSEGYNIDINRYGNYKIEEFSRSNLYKVIAGNIRNLIIQDIVKFKESKI